MLLLFDAHTAVAVLYDSETQRELLSHGVVAFNGTGSRPFVVSRGGGSGKYITRGTAHRRSSPTTPTCPMSRQQPSSPAFLRGASGTAVPMPGKEISPSGEKKSQKSLDATHNNIIFAASNYPCGQNAAGIHPAIFVPLSYRNQRITTPCRESGNRPGASARISLTARSVVTIFMSNYPMQKQKQIAFTRRKIALTFTLLNVNAILLKVKETCSQILLILLNLARIGKNWQARENAWFSAWCQEPVTNIEVLRAAVGVLVGLPVALIIAGLVLGGGAS